MSDYTSRMGKIYVTTLTNANTWYPVLTEAQAKYTKGYKIKSRFVVGQGAKPFDYAFKSAPDSGDSAGDGYYSNSGAGSGDEAAPTSGIWARSATAGTVIEVAVYG